MAITYPLTLPAHPKPRRVDLEQRVVVVTTESPYTLSQTAIAHPGERWELAVELPPMKREGVSYDTAAGIAAEWEAALVSLRGPFGSFRLASVDMTGPRGAVSGIGNPTVRVRGSHAARARVLAGDFTPAGAHTGFLKKGDFIRVGAHLHMVLNDADSNASGQFSVDIWPALREAAANNATVAVGADVYGTWRLTHAAAWSVDEMLNHGLTFSAVEAI